MSSDSGRRIAKNTIYLYIRMIIVMGVSLFTVRIVLNALGAEDYGIYNVVGGVVTMFAFLTSTMTSASQRFFSYSIGRGDKPELSRYFSVTLWSYIGIALFIIIIAETIGLWFVKNKLIIPDNRIDAAIIVYHCSIVSFVFNILSVPYNSIIIAKEHMQVYALVGLLEAFLKLIIAYLLFISPFDKLIVYSILMSVLTLLVSVFYLIYCNVKYAEVRNILVGGYKELKEIIGFSLWSLFGAISGVIRSQGINILLNVFFNPVVNAARAIAYQINNAINMFVLNFFKAVQPQITKYYASGETRNLLDLIYSSSRFCYYLIFVFALPLLLEVHTVLDIWLDEVPNMTVLFTRLVIINAVVDSVSYPLQTSISATGNIKYFQLITGGLLIVNLPVSWVFLKLGFSPQITMYISIIISLVAQITRVIFAKIYNGLSIKSYLYKVIFPIMKVSFFASILPLLLHFTVVGNVSRMIIVIIVSVLASIISCFYFGVTNDERVIVLNYINSRFKLWKI